MTKQEKVAELAERIGGRVRSYSGRGMFGRECMGVTCDDADEAIMECGRLRLPKPSVDSMGLAAIVYWPSIDVPTK